MQKCIIRYGGESHEKDQKHRFFTGFLLVAALLELAVIVYMFLPTGEEQAMSAWPSELESLRSEQRLSAVIPQMEEKQTPESTPASEADAGIETESVSDEPEVLEKEKPEGERSATEILADAQVIAHGMGSIGGLETPNCLEGFLAQYEAGVRVFEVDLRLTRDVKNVLRHDWWHAEWQKGIDWVNIPTREKFLAEKILDKYTPLSFQDLLLLMEEYPDICVITDTKFTEPDVFFIQFDSMLADARELGLTYLFDRILIQVYGVNMHTALNNIYPFPHYIYTLYQDGFTGGEKAFREKAAYCAKHGIEGITMNEYWWKPAYDSIAKEYGIKVYVHTVNDIDKAKKCLNEGISAIYTDSIIPTDISG